MIKLKADRHNLVFTIVETTNNQKSLIYTLQICAIYNIFNTNLKRLFLAESKENIFSSVYLVTVSSQPRTPGEHMWRHACYLLCLQNIFPPIPHPHTTPHRTGNRTGDLSGIPAANSTSTPRPKHMFCHDFQWGSSKFRLGVGSRSKTTPDNLS